MPGQLFQSSANIETVSAQIVTKEDGSQAIRFPIVSLVADSVLNWYFIPADSVKASVANWVGKPITIQHPPPEAEEAVAFLADADNIAGRIVESRMVGHKLVHIGEIEYPGSTAIKKALAQNILDGKTEEVSTGYIAWPEKRSGTTTNGKEYTEVHRDIAPDHLALLPGGTGACSIDDGCGTLRANSLMTARTIAAASVETNGQADLTLAAFVARWNADHANAPITGLDDATPEARKWIASHTLLGDPNAKTEADLLAFPVVNPATGALNRAAVIACLSDRQSQIALGKERRASLHAAAGKLLARFAEHSEAVTEAANEAEELDLDDRMRLVGNAIWEKYAPGPDEDPEDKPWPYIQSVKLDHVIFEAGAATYRVNYELTEVDGIWSVSLGERVRGSMQFVPDSTTNAALAKAKKFFRRLTGNGDDPQGVTMTRNELITKVAAKLDWTEEQTAKTFQSASDCDLKKIAGETEAPKRETTAQNSDTNAAEGKTEQANPETTAAPKLTREAIAEAVPEFAQFLAQQNAAETQVRTQAKAKAKALGLTEADIDATPVAVLQQLMRGGQSSYLGISGAELFGQMTANGDLDDEEFDPADVSYMHADKGSKAVQ